MDISDKLADLNWQRNQDWKTPFTPEKCASGRFCFRWRCLYLLGCLFDSTEKLAVLQDRLRILSGLYGLLKPLDLIQAYRLKMEIYRSDKESKPYNWKPVIAKALNKELHKGELFVNLASNEYFGRIAALKVPVITPNSRITKMENSRLSVFFAKKARGLDGALHHRYEC